MGNKGRGEKTKMNKGRREGQGERANNNKEFSYVFVWCLFRSLIGPKSGQNPKKKKHPNLQPHIGLGSLVLLVEQFFWEENSKRISFVLGVLFLFFFFLKPMAGQKTEFFRIWFQEDFYKTFGVGEDDTGEKCCQLGAQGINLVRGDHPCRFRLYIVALKKGGKGFEGVFLFFFCF